MLSETEPERRTRRVCEVPGCERKLHAFGLCHVHAPAAKRSAGYRALGLLSEWDRTRLMEAAKERLFERHRNGNGK